MSNFIRILRLFAVALLAVPLAACMGSGEYVSPYQQLGHRIEQSSAVNNKTNADAQSTLVCPAGMKPAPGSHQVDIRNDTQMSYREQSPGNNYGYRGGGYTYGRSDYSTYSSQDVEVEAETTTESRGQISCVPIIDIIAKPQGQ
ncbi:MAG: hypothetical protein RLZZ480_517 [Candidatus Parcubacteria bacterium]|jgi:hypothetical protein